MEWLGLIMVVVLVGFAVECMAGSIVAKWFQRWFE